MTDAQMAADMKALMVRLVRTEQSLDGYSTASRSCGEGHSTTRGRSKDW